MWNQLNQTDRRILATASLLLLMMLYLLYDDSILFPTKDTTGLPPIGRIVHSDQDVRRKISKQFFWKSARSSDQVYTGDSVFTGQGSSAEIEFADGRKLKLQENSLVVFTENKGQKTLDLRFGRLAGQIEGCLKINIQGQEKEICGNDSQEVLEIDSEGIVESKAPPKETPGILVWNPSPPTPFYHYKNQNPLHLSWKANRSYGRFHLQLSSDPEFKKIAYSERTQKTQISTRGYPASGEFYIRIQADDRKGQAATYSKVEKIRIEEVAPPVITTPLSGTRLSIKTNYDGDLLESNQVDVRWTYQLTGVRFEMEIATDKNFQEIVTQKRDMTTLEAQSGKLLTGSYYVRVRDATVSNGINRPWSAPVAFDVDINRPPKLPAPQLLTQNIDYLAPDPETPVLKWDKVENAAQYIVDIAPTPEFEALTSFTVSDTKLPLTEITPGKTYFRVRAQTEKGTVSPEVPTGTVHVRFRKPQVQVPEPIVVMGKSPEDPGDPQTVKLSWTDLKYIGSYTVELSKDSSFKDKQEFQSETPNMDVTLQNPGDYFVRVKAVSKTGRDLTRYSAPEPLKYVLKVPLATPVLAEPFDQVTLFFQKNTSPYLWFEWGPVRQASKYLFEVALDPEFNNKVLSTTSKSRRYLVKESLPQSTLYWRVQAVGDDERISHWSQPRKLNIFSGRKPAGR